MATPPPPFPGAPATIRLPVLVCVLIILVAALTPFLPTLDNGLVWDDHLFLENNPALLQPQQVFNRMLSVQDQYTPYYRPLSVLWWSAERILLRLDARGLHLANMLLHGTVALLVLLICLRLLPPLPALLGSLLFAVHTVHVEPVAFLVAGGTELLPAAFLLGSLLALLPQQTGPGEPWQPGRARLWASAGLYLCALLSKEVTVGLPLLAAALLLTRGPSRLRTWRGATATLLPFAVAALAYAVLRGGAMLATASAPTLPMKFVFSWQTPAWLFASLVALLSPYQLLPFHELTPLSPGQFLLLAVLLAALTLCVLLLGRARRWDPPVLLGAGLLLITLLPSAPLLPRGGAVVAARFLYMPSAGLSLLVGCALAQAGGRVPRRFLAVAVAAFAGAVVFLGATTALRTRDWHDDRTLASRGLERDPGNQMLLLMRGQQLLAEKRYPEAERHVSAVLRRDPDQWQAKVYLGQIYEEQGRLDAAQKLYRSMLSETPLVAARAWFGLGMISKRSGRGGDGEREFLEALRLNPSIVPAYLNLGLIAYQRRDLERTARYLERGLEIDPANPHLLNGLGMTARDRGDYRAARAYLERALKAQPSLESARRALEGLPPGP